MLHLPCCLISVIFYLGIFVIRDIAAGDRCPLFQKCKIAESPLFIEFEFRYRDVQLVKIFFPHPGKDTLFHYLLFNQWS